MVVMQMMNPADASAAKLMHCGSGPVHPANTLSPMPAPPSSAWVDNSCPGSATDTKLMWLPQGMLHSDGSPTYSMPPSQGMHHSDSIPPYSSPPYSNSQHSVPPAMLVGADGELYPSLQQGEQHAMGNTMMYTNLWQLPEQTVVSGCDASKAYMGNRAIAVMSMESLPTMAILSMDSLPTMSVMSMDNLPTMPVQTTDSRAFAVNSAESLPSLPSRKTSAKLKKRNARKNLAASEPHQSRGSDAFEQHETQELRRAVSERMQQLAANKNQQAAQAALVKQQLSQVSAANRLCEKQVKIMSGATQEGSSLQASNFQSEDLEEVKEPDVDPVMMELESEDDTTLRRTLEWVVSSVWPLVLTRRGSRILQKALDVGTPNDQLQILNRLEGHVQEAMRSPHGNYVLQKCIEVVAPERVQFIIDELKGDAVVAARHRFGCRILQRLIEHCPAEQTEGITVEVLSDVASLCRHQFGNFVVQHILQHGSPAHKKGIADILHGEIIRLAKHRIASHVVSCAMVHCAPEDVHRLTQVVIADRGQLADLSRREYGSFVVREVNRARRLHG